MSTKTTSERLGAICLAALLIAATARGGEPAGAGKAEASAQTPAAAQPAAGVRGEAKETVRLTLDEAVRMALTNAERIGASQASYRRADAAVLQAWSGTLPTVAGSAGLSRTKTEVQTTALGTKTGGYSSLYNSSVQLSQPLFTGGSVYYGVKAAKDLRKAAFEDVRTSKQATIFNAAQDYYDTVLANEVLGVVRSTYELAKRHYEDIQAREKVGTASKFDVLRAKVSMQNQESEVINAANSASQAVAQLVRETGLPQGTQLDLVEGFGKVGETPTLEAAVRTAMELRPDLRSAELSTRAQKNTVGSTRAGYLPRVSATASWGGSAVEDPFADDHFTEAGTLGASLQWNIFDGALTRARVAEARADLDRLEWVSKGLRRDVELQVQQALLSLESARTFIAAQGANVDEAQEALHLAEARQKAGAGTELDVEDARNALQQAQLNYARSLYQYSSARLALEQATGELGKQ